ncbi:restriction endonuclease subunit S [Chryseobacterium carnipullorum]|uniref:Restriction endonuclease subunit S n=2 Tax=Chryseobacterium group TaxID=2782232 RepID=A0A3G6LWQ8_CHRCU|nr:restriction endonuclease subunit S [Chryseobacterium carnipullorum]AZA46907.1 restriction endonuclease subunit S [Chryseobacterium carnipullorum]
MSNWKQTSIGEFIDFNPSESLPKNGKVKKIPMDRLGVFERKIKGYEFSEYKSGPKFRNGDTLVAKITPCLENGKTAYVDILDDEEVAFGSSEFIVLRENENSDSNFIYYLARSPLFREKAISCMEGTSGRKRVNEGALKRQEILVPNNKLEQQKIASVLSTIDDKIELNNRINDNLEQMAKTLYDYWFVQFDFPDENGKPYKSSGGKMVWNEVLKREIPIGWELKIIGDYCKSRGGFAFKSSWWTTFGESVIKIKDIQENCTLNLSDLSLVNLEGKNIDDKFKAKAGDIVIAMTGATVGKYAIVPNTNKQLYVNQRVGYFDLGLSPTIKLPYLINSLNQKYFREAIFTLASGAAQPNISNEQINSIQLLMPTNQLIENFNSQLKSSYDKILNNQNENQQLSSLRDWLLPMLMNGQVKVE